MNIHNYEKIILYNFTMQTSVEERCNTIFSFVDEFVI
jgi:hypothetical protein